MQTLWRTFASLCAVTVIVALLIPLRALGSRLSIWLIIFAIAMFAVWGGINAYAQPMSMSGRWWMFRICLAGFLSMLLSFITALRSPRGTRAGLVAFVSVAIAVAHFMGMILSIPVS